MGTVVALPLLDAMVPAFVKPPGVADAPGDSVFPERRPDGHLGHQERRAIGASDALPHAGAPTKYRNDITVLNGLTVDAAARMATVLATMGARPAT